MSPRKLWRGPPALMIAQALVSHARLNAQVPFLLAWAEGGPAPRPAINCQFDALKTLCQVWPSACVVRLAELCGVIPEL